MIQNKPPSSSPDNNKALDPFRKRAEWISIAILLVVLSLAQAQIDANSLYINVGTDPYYHLIATHLHANPDLYQNDPVFHEAGYASRLYTAYPVYLILLHAAVQIFSFFTALSIFQVLLSLIYLGSATFVLYKFSGRPWISTLIACLSARQTPVFPSEQWGVLSAAMVVPGTCFLAFSPLLFWGWLNLQDKPLQKRLLFLVQGFLGIIHPLSWYTMTLSMILAQLAKGRFKLASIIDTMICGALSFLPLLPFALAWYTGKKLSQLPAGSYQAGREALYTVFPSLRLETITTGLIHALDMDFGWILLTLLALVKIHRQVPKVTLYFAGGCILLFLVSYAINECILIPYKLPLFLDGNRTLKFLFLPAMLAITLWLAQFKGVSLQLRSAAVFLLIVSFNFQLFWIDLQKQPMAITHYIYDQWQAFTAERNPFDYLQQKNLYETSAWLKQHINPATSLIYVSYPNKNANFMIRALGEKSVAYAYSDGGFIYQTDPANLMAWRQRGQAIEQLHRNAGFCGAMEISYAKTLKATHIVCPKWQTPTGLTLLYSNEMTSILAL